MIRKLNPIAMDRKMVVQIRLQTAVLFDLSLQMVSKRSKQNLKTQRLDMAVSCSLQTGDFSSLSKKTLLALEVSHIFGESKTESPMNLKFPDIICILAIVITMAYIVVKLLIFQRDSMII